MGTLIYFLTASLDGYINDEQGRIDWTAPDDEVLAFVNDRLRGVGTFLMGRRMYEVAASARLSSLATHRSTGWQRRSPNRRSRSCAT